MDKTEFPARSLPDIEMYGGDTTPWEMTLVDSDGAEYPSATASACTYTLCFSPSKATTGLGGDAAPIAPLLKKVGTIKEGATVVFSFSKEDTIGLRGKYLYQIEVSKGTDLRVAQGHVYIKQNVNRAAK